MRKLNDFDFKGKKTIVRVDFNVPIINDVITDDNRIKESLETINYLIEKEAKIILMSHLGKVKTEEDIKNNSLEKVSKRLSELINKEVVFINKTRGKKLEDTINNLNNGNVLLMENTRFEDYPNNLESDCDEELSKYWASLGELFVLDAFGSAHRNHASTYGIPSHILGCAGFLIEKELNVLSEILNNKKDIIMGGAKVKDKLGVIVNLIDSSNKILIGGGMAYTFLKAKGYNIGKSILDTEKLDYVRDLLNKYNDKIILPLDVVTQNGIKDADKMNDEDEGFDIGPKTISLFKSILGNSKLVVWNGPLGMFENKEYAVGTKEILYYLHDNNIKTIIAGGDTGSAANQYGLSFYHISTGGGATLEYLEGKKFKTLEILEENHE
jgi:phosphoglycerate kinase